MKVREIPKMYFDFVITGSTSLFPGLKTGNQMDHYPNFDDRYYDKYSATNYYIMKFANLATTCNFGLPGSIEIARTCLTLKNSYGYKVTRPDATFLSSILKIMFGNDNLPVSYLDNWANPIADEFNTANFYLDTATFLKILLKKSAQNRFRGIYGTTEKNYFKNDEGEQVILNENTAMKDIKYLFVNADSYISSGEFPYSILPYGKLFFFVLKSDPSHHVLLTRTDFSRLINYFESLAGAHLYANLDIIYKKDYSYSNLITEFLELYHNTPSNYLDKFCESWLSATRALKCILAGPLSANSYNIQIAERNAKGDDKVVDIDVIIALAALKDPKNLVDVQALARLCMPSDFDVTAIFTEEEKLHSNKNPIGIEISEAAEIVYKGFLTYQRYFFITTYFKHFGRLPGILRASHPDAKLVKAYNSERNKWPKLQESDAVHVDLFGCLNYKKRSKDLDSYMKDAGMMPNDVSIHLSKEKAQKKDTNMLVHLLEADTKIDLEAYRNEYHKIEHCIKAGLKVESGKELGRLFFMYDLKDKMLMAELEENISDFLIHTPGNAVGTSNVVIRDKMLKYNKLETFIKEDIKPLFLSDDVSKWSPHMPVRVQEDSAKFWAEIYGQDWISHIQEIDKKDTVTINIMNYRAAYNSNGANKEGTSGKRFTFLMIAMKAYCVNILRGKKGGHKYIEGAARLLTFLDDGLTIIDISAKNYFRDANAVIDKISEIQSFIGYTLKVSKCYPSDKYMIFLNYEYFAGKRIYDRGKSFVKLFPRKNNDLLSFPERLREASTWAIGAIESSAEPLEVYVAYLYRISVEEIAWDPKVNYELTLKLLHWTSPIALGGLGVLPLHSLSSGVSRSSIVESVKTMQVLAKRNKYFLHAYKSIIVTPISAKNSLQILRSPETIVYATPHYTEHRVVQAIEEHILKDCTSVYLKDAIGILASKNILDFADEIMSHVKIANKMTIDAIYNASPIAYIDKIIAKVKKASTVASLLSNEVRSRIQASHYKEVSFVTKAFFERLSFLI